VVEVQVTVPQKQFVLLRIFPVMKPQFDIEKMLHQLSVTKQYNPVEVEHVLAPQIQSVLFVTRPVEFGQLVKAEVLHQLSAL